jgi:hypothetical protein
MGESIDSTLFIPTSIKQTDNHGRHPVGALQPYFYFSGDAVTFQLPRESYVSLKLYSVLGKETAQLAGKKFASGKYTIAFTNQNLAKGMYLCRIMTDDFSETGKFIHP